MKYSEEAERAVQLAARSAASSWRGVAEYEDIHQDLWLFLLETPSVQNKPSEELEKILRWKANSLCKQAQVDYEHFSGNFQYTPGDVRAGAVSMMEFDGAPEEQADYDLAIEILWKHKPEKFEDLDSWFGNPDGWDQAVPSVRKRAQRMFDALADAMNDVRRARERNKADGPGTKPREVGEPLTINDFTFYKTGVVENG